VTYGVRVTIQSCTLLQIAPKSGHAEVFQLLLIQEKVPWHQNREVQHMKGDVAVE